MHDFFTARLCDYLVSIHQRITQRLSDECQRLNLTGELKWSKISVPYAEKYCTLMDRFFEEAIGGNLKMRIMFTQNAVVPVGLTHEQYDREYFLLYYQFIKHAFGLRFIPPVEGEMTQRRLRLYFDQFPDTREVASQFKGYIQALENSNWFRNIPLKLAARDVSEVRSHDHLLLQCLDVVLGYPTHGVELRSGGALADIDPSSLWCQHWLNGWLPTSQHFKYTSCSSRRNT